MQKIFISNFNLKYFFMNFQRSFDAENRIYRLDNLYNLSFAKMRNFV